jgi:hypothetical protein
MVAGLEAGDAFADFNDHARTFMPEYYGEQTLRIVSGQSECVSVANAGVRNLDQYFASARRRYINLYNL